MTIDTIAIKKEQQWPAAANSGQHLSAKSLAGWRIAQYAALLLGMALVATLLLRPAPAPTANYGISVSLKAGTTAAEFARLMLSPTGQHILADFGFISIGLPAE